VELNNECLKIPYRIYADIPDEELIQKLPIRQQQIISCVLTRHHNGYIRERHLKKILLINEPWIVPYISQLIGEYVIEILTEISNKLVRLEMKNFNRFFDDNPKFYYITKQRVRSYWDCYYKEEYKVFNDYIGNKIITHFESVRGSGNNT